MKSAADIVRDLLFEACPHETHPAIPRVRGECGYCLTAALTEFGDARAAQELEACANEIKAAYTHPIAAACASMIEAHRSKP